jgi:hypothetical protein
VSVRRVAPDTRRQFQQRRRELPSVSGVQSGKRARTATVTLAAPC